jgi:hypothetical protein
MYWKFDKEWIQVPPHKIHITYKRKKNNFTIEKPGRHHINEVIKIETTHEKNQNHTTRIQCYFWYSWQKKMYNINFTVTKISDKTKSRAIIQNNWLEIFKNTKTWTFLKDQGTVADWRDLKNTWQLNTILYSILLI